MENKADAERTNDRRTEFRGARDGISRMVDRNCSGMANHSSFFVKVARETETQRANRAAFSWHEAKGSSQLPRFRDSRCLVYDEFIVEFCNMSVETIKRECL